MKEARDTVIDYQRMVAKGIDPIDHKRGKQTGDITFADVASEYLDVQAKHRQPSL